MNIILNGELKQTEAQSITELLKELKLNPQKIVAECNGEVIAREKYDSTTLKANDRLELVQFVGGG